ncbi:MAG TPA: Calx-beta domain-containing protein [Marinobacter sp.]|uniref:Calx-beta domain-containing protein n=1 Tax=Marinobacter sp. TaxID=50741 RepID=UPI002D7FFEC0|nr:Calx-beta domain-containing protein [Marinobacter sp.]HET8801910.1 Calx-beta domain-containing protein [Marinobacter sp.]
MRADWFPRPVSVTATRITVVRWAGLILALLVVSGCKTERAADQPTVLGTPPATAYLGVEYYYNFGAYGGEGILDYSLTNAPAWLALEDTSNKARQGIIMRGVPGLTGGARGEDDLGRIQDINLITTDGQNAGVQPFDIEVKYNPLSLDAETFIEGESPDIPETPREHCSPPDLDTPGEHSFTINEYNQDGTVSGTRTLTAATRPVAVKVLLEKPSVTRVSVAFNLTSEYDPSRCDPDVNAPHQRCDHSDANRGEAIVGQDIVALGSGSGVLLEEPAYLSYQQDEDGVYTSGLVTFEPGVTECYIRLEVIDDQFPEPSEAGLLTLTEVRNGLAGLGENNGGAKTSLVVDDNEPRVTLETVNGGLRDAINVGGSVEYVARLTGERDGEFRAKLGETEDSTARLGSEFTTSAPGNQLVFAADEDEVRFTVTVPQAGYANGDLPDRVILLGLDETYQAGREGYARPSDAAPLRISINELTAPLAVGDVNGFVATDIDIGHSGRLFVAGFDAQDNNRVKVRIYNQKGTLLQDVAVSDAGDQLAAPAPVIDAALRKVSEDTGTVDRFEFVVAYSTDAPVAGTTALGGQDALISLYHFDPDSNGGEYVAAWTHRSGTTEDDVARWAGINRESGFIVLAGETRGEWAGQTASGGVDSFLQRIDSVNNGNELAPLVAWTRQVGSAADDAVAGGSAAAITPLVFGSAEGAVNGEPVLGGVDAYFYSAASASGNLSVYQRGTEGNEVVNDGLFASANLWLLGNSAGAYSVTTNEDEERSLDRVPTSSGAGFLLGYSTAGQINRAVTLNDPDDASEEALAAITPFFSDLVVAGSTLGDFTGDAMTTGVAQGIVARVSPVPEPDPEAEPESLPFRNEWRYQLDAADSAVRALANYRDDEIVAFVRRGGTFEVLIFSPEGVLLTPVN